MKSEIKGVIKDSHWITIYLFSVLKTSVDALLKVVTKDHYSVLVIKYMCAQWIHNEQEVCFEHDLFFCIPFCE